MESERHEEKYRAIIDGETRDEPVSQRWGRSSLSFDDEGVLIRPPHQGDCGRHGTEGQRVTSGELGESSGGTGVNEPISGSEVGSDALEMRTHFHEHDFYLPAWRGSISPRRPLCISTLGIATTTKVLPVFRTQDADVLRRPFWNIRSFS